ncbi:uncharacterized protein LOC143242823 isoform X3 [Tachypleus tridentatus]|uniref:uncharacterized protein LOC143242823 isoform X3 n=1 Tax=Tachypleus tridentatus TaxID=6853 RepID=UPI003FD682EB
MEGKPKIELQCSKTCGVVSLSQWKVATQHLPTHLQCFGGKSHVYYKIGCSWTADQT